MNISYVAESESGLKPKIKKRLTASSGEVLEVQISEFDTEEMKSIGTEVIFSHLRNLVDHIKTLSENISITEKDDIDLEPWPVKGWKEIESINSEIIRWWEFAYYRDEPDEEEEPLDA